MSISRRIFEVLVAFALLQPIVCAQSVLLRKDVNAATADAREIGELYGSMETYFTRRGNAANAVKLSKEGRDLAATVAKSVAANDFAAASQAALSIAHACRPCHLEYKPLE